MVGALEAAHEAIKSLVVFRRRYWLDSKSKMGAGNPDRSGRFRRSLREFVDRDKLAGLMLTPGKHAKDKALKNTGINSSRPSSRRLTIAGQKKR